MKKWMKGIAITGTVLLLVGTAITALAAAVGNIRRESSETLERYHFGSGVLGHIGDALRIGRDYAIDYDHDSDSEHPGSWAFEEGLSISPVSEMKLAGSFKMITKIQIETERATVKIVENPELTDEIRVYMKEDGDAVLNMEHDKAEELSVKYSRTSHHSWREQNRGYTQGIVEVPAGYRFLDAELSVEAGYMGADVVRADDLEAKVQAGEIRLGSFQAVDAEFTAEAGSITAAGVFDTSLVMDAKAGALHVSLPGSDQDYDFYLHNAVGNVVIGDAVYSGLISDEKVGSGSGKTVDIDCAAGSAEIQFTGEKPKEQ